MRILIVGMVLGFAGCHTPPPSCDAHLTPINRPVAASSAASTPPGRGAPGERGAP